MYSTRNYSTQGVASAIDQAPELRGAGIAVLEDNMCRVDRRPEHDSGFDTWVVLEPVDVPPAPEVLQPPERPSSIGRELIGATLSCGGAVIAGAGAASTIAAAPATAGASLLVTATTSAAALAAAAQCGMSMGRLLNGLFSPNSNDQLDSSAWYARTNFTLDAIGTVGAVASLGQSAQGVARLLQAQRVRGGTMIGMLKGMKRVARKQLAVDIARYMGKATTRRQFIRMSRLGKIPKVWKQTHIDQFFMLRLGQTIADGLSLDQGYGTIFRPLSIRIEQEN